jgi:hypothetical protein
MPLSRIYCVVFIGVGVMEFGGRGRRPSFVGVVEARVLGSSIGAAFAQLAVSVVLPNSDPLVGETIVTIASSGFDGAAP